MGLIGDYGYFGRESLDKNSSIVEEALTTWEEHLKRTESFADLK
jgi:hypothetical protein